MNPQQRFSSEQLNSQESTAVHTPKLSDAPHSSEAINLVDVCRQLLRIVARLEESSYTDKQIRQTEVVVHSDLTNPASEESTAPG